MCVCCPSFDLCLSTLVGVASCKSFVLFAGRCADKQVERLAVNSDGREIHDVAPTISTIGSLLRVWLARNDRAVWRARHGHEILTEAGRAQTANGTWISVDNKEQNSSHCVSRARL